MTKKKKKKKDVGHQDCCGPHCMFFPQNPSTILDETVGDDGVKRRTVVRSCRYDGIQITGWSSNEKKCPEFDSL